MRGFPYSKIIYYSPVLLYLIALLPKAIAIPKIITNTDNGPQKFPQPYLSSTI